MKHKVEDVQKLLDDAEKLLRKVTNGGSGSMSAYSIILDLDAAITNLSENWKGVDAGVQINRVTSVYNEMIPFRNKMADMALAAFDAGLYYRNIQSSNGAPVQVPGMLQDDVSLGNKSEYVDNRDTVNINPGARAGKEKLDSATRSFEDLKSTFSAVKNEILNNWTEGDKRGEFESYFENFESKMTGYEEILSNVSEDITKALENYEY